MDRNNKRTGIILNGRDSAETLSYVSYNKNLNNIREKGNKARTELCRVRAIYNPNPPASD